MHLKDSVRMLQAFKSKADIISAESPSSYTRAACCLGCDFTLVRSGITGIGYKTFVSLTTNVESELTAGNLAGKISEEQNVIAQADEFGSAVDIEAHRQRGVDVYSTSSAWMATGPLQPPTRRSRIWRRETEFLDDGYPTHQLPYRFLPKVV